MGEVKKDCYWYRGMHPTRVYCNVLVCMQCENGECSFYETREQYKARVQKYLELKQKKKLLKK